MSEEFRKEKPAKSVGHILLDVLVALLCIVFVPIVIMNTVLIVKGALDDSRPPSVFGVTPLVVLSDEMDDGSEDAILAGDLILVRGTDADAVEVGDIISYVSNGNVRTQRVKYANADGTFYTKGDADLSMSYLNQVSPENIVGEYFFRIPYIGEAVLFMQSPTGVLVTIGIPLALFIIYDVIRRQMQKREEAVKRDPPEQSLPEFEQDPDQVFLPREVLKKPSLAVSEESETGPEKTAQKVIVENDISTNFNNAETDRTEVPVPHKVKVIVGSKKRPAEKKPVVVKVKVRKSAV